jgi:hypothetical protein
MAVRVRRQAWPDVRHVDALLQERARPGLRVVDLLWRVIEELASFLCTVVYILVHSVGRIESRTVLNLGHWQGNSVSHHP